MSSRRSTPAAWYWKSRQRVPFEDANCMVCPTRHRLQKTFVWALKFSKFPPTVFPTCLHETIFYDKFYAKSYQHSKSSKVSKVSCGIENSLNVSWFFPKLLIFDEERVHRNWREPVPCRPELLEHFACCSPVAPSGAAALWRAQHRCTMMQHDAPGATLNGINKAFMADMATWHVNTSDWSWGRNSCNGRAWEAELLWVFGGEICSSNSSPHLCILGSLCLGAAEHSFGIWWLCCPVWSVWHGWLQTDHQRRVSEHHRPGAWSTQASSWWSLPGASGHGSSLYLGWETPCQCSPKMVQPSKGPPERTSSVNWVLAIILFCSARRPRAPQDCQGGGYFDCGPIRTTSWRWYWRTLTSWTHGYNRLHSSRVRWIFFVHKDSWQGLFSHTWLGTTMARWNTGISWSCRHDHEATRSVGRLAFSGKQAATAPVNWRCGRSPRSSWK